MSTRSEHYRGVSDDDLQRERDACLTLMHPEVASDRVIEFHADIADLISDEIDRRADR